MRVTIMARRRPSGIPARRGANAWRHSRRSVRRSLPSKCARSCSRRPWCIPAVRHVPIFSARDVAEAPLAPLTTCSSNPRRRRCGIGGRLADRHQRHRRRHARGPPHPVHAGEGSSPSVQVPHRVAHLPVQPTRGRLHEPPASGADINRMANLACHRPRLTT